MKVSASKLAFSVVITSVLAIFMLMILTINIIRLNEQYNIKSNELRELASQIGNVSISVGMSFSSTPSYYQRFFAGSALVLQRSSLIAQEHDWEILKQLIDQCSRNIISWEKVFHAKPDSSLSSILRSQTILQISRIDEEIDRIADVFSEQNRQTKKWQVSLVVGLSLLLLLFLLTISQFYYIGFIRPLKVAAQKIREVNTVVLPDTNAIVISEITDFLEVIDEAQKTLIYQAGHDDLTDLPNRALFREHLEHTITLCKRQNSSCVIYYIDLDDFKTINDSLGHQIGDLVLLAQVERMRSILRQSDILSRQGGDEFTIMVEAPMDLDNIGRFAAKLIDFVTQPIDVDGHQLSTSACVGIAIYPQDGTTTEALLRNADAALYCAKSKGKGSFHYYTAELTEQAEKRLVLERDLKVALEQDQFTLFYQPQVCIETNHLIGFEALIRWQHPINGLLSPSVFLPIAEESLLIVSIGEWVMERACQQIRQWLDAGYKSPRISINIVAAQLKQQTFVKLLRDTLKKHRVSAEYLTLELTESTLLKASPSVIYTMNEIRAMGIHIAIDDFGTGYSNLKYLQNLPIDTLKIDQSFVRMIGEDRDGTTIVDAIIMLANGFKLDLIAEGVEQSHQAQYLLEKGCKSAQGFLYARPSPAEKIVELLELSDPT